MINGLKEYALGEKFVHDGFEYICFPDTGCCVDCGFHEVACFCNNNDLACLARERSDSNRVSFKRLGDKKKTEFAVGEEFQYGLKTLRCVKPKNPGLCEGCYFEGQSCDEEERGRCVADSRSDGENVIFVEVKPENK